MATELNSFSPTEPIVDDVSNYVDDLLVERIWRRLDKQVTREHIRHVALEVAAEFRGARITTFVPIFIRRLTLDRLSNSRSNKNNEH